MLQLLYKFFIMRTSWIKIISKYVSSKSSNETQQSTNKQSSNVTASKITPFYLCIDIVDSTTFRTGHCISWMYISFICMRFRKCTLF